MMTLATLKVRALAFLASWTGRAILAAISILAVWWIVASLTGSKTAKVEADLNAERKDAAIASGADAANSVGEVGSRADQTDATTKENADDIRNAEGSDQEVHPDAAAAGRDSLCKRAAYRDKPECLQRAPAR